MRFSRPVSAENSPRQVSINISIEFRTGADKLCPLLKINTNKFRVVEIGTDKFRVVKIDADKFLSAFCGREGGYKTIPTGYIPGRDNRIGE